MSRYEHYKHTGTIESHIKKFTSFPGLCGLGNVCLFSNFPVLIINCAFHTQKLGFIHHLGVLIPQRELIKITTKLVPNKNMVMGVGGGGGWGGWGWVGVGVGVGVGGGGGGGGGWGWVGGVGGLNLTNSTFLNSLSLVGLIHDDVIKWKHFPRYWPFNSPVSGEFPAQRPVTRSFDVEANNTWGRGGGGGGGVSQSHQLNFFEQFKFGRTNTWWRHQMETFSALLAI